MDERFLHSICDFFSSDEWWRPICGFLSTNCGKFQSDSNSFEQYQTFLQFQSLVSEFFDSFLCKKLNVRPHALEQIMIQAYDSNQYQIRVIISLIKDLFDFEKFKYETRLASKMIEEETENAMGAIRNQTTQGDDETVAMNAVEMLEKSEEISLQKQTQLKCQMMKDKFKLSDFSLSKTLPQKHMSMPQTQNLVMPPLAPIATPTLMSQTRGAEMRKSLGSPGKPLIMKPTGISKLRGSKLGPLK